MRHPKNVQTRTSHQKDLSSLKKLPARKPAARKKKPDTLNIDIVARKDYSSIITLLKRKFSRSSPSKIPTGLKPMLATLVDEPFSDANWQFELKLDGYRALAYIQKGKVELRSRNDNSFNKKICPHS